MLNSDKIAIIEFDNSHDELLYSQVKFLNTFNLTPHILVNDSLEKRLFFLKDFCEFKTFPPAKSFFRRIKMILDIFQYIKINRIKKIILNSAHGILVRDFCLMAPGNIEIIGVLHYVDKLSGSFTQKLISSKVKKYFVLNDYLLQLIKNEGAKQFQSFYPIFFNSFIKIDTKKRKDEIWITIPGPVEFLKRDYLGLIDNIKNLTPEIKFIFLGRSDSADGRMLKDIAERKGLLNNFKFFDGFIDWDLFLSYLNDSDIIMPLIHPSNPRFEDYLYKHISGSFNLSFGLGIPMLIHESFSDKSDFQISSIFYSVDKLQEVIMDCPIKRDKLLDLRTNILSYPKFSFDYQSKNYIDFLNK
jgi:glycosyltransferase involved in cell wall biosynthesis